MNPIVLDIIQKNLPIKKSKKDKNGEVFTPLTLVNEMLDKLPAEVWSNPNLKWLDPANGVGNFPVVVYYRLMDGLQDCILIEEERSKHIIENMLYMVELDQHNCDVCKKIFSIINPNAVPNIDCRSFL